MWPLILLALNVIGAVVYVFRASLGWRIAAEHGAVPVTGEPFVWFIGILPVVAVFLILNIIWGALVLARPQRLGGRLWLSSAAVWFIAICIDFAHH
jgi:hypothetical protein